MIAGGLPVDKVVATGLVLVLTVWVVLSARVTQGLEIMKFTLTQPCLDLDTVTAHISDMKVRETDSSSSSSNY